MKVNEIQISGVKIITQNCYHDQRGYFVESYNQARFDEYSDLESSWVQDNLSYSKKGALRGLHYQFPHAQAKLIQVVKGYIWDVVLDLRQDSPTFKQWQGFYLQDPLLNPNKQLELLYIPEGCAHGFLTISEEAIVHYKVAERYYPQEEQTLVFNDPDIAIEWPLHVLPVDIPLILSEKDRQGKTVSQLPLF